MKGEKGITPVTGNEGLGEELTDETFSKCKLYIKCLYISLRYKFRFISNTVMSVKG